MRDSGADTYVTNAAGTPTLTIRQADPAGITPQSVFGATDPIQGWYSNGYGAKQPGWALEDIRAGKTALFTTLLTAGPYAGQASDGRRDCRHRCSPSRRLRRWHRWLLGEDPE